MNERDAIVLGALLHDIGKFYQRTGLPPEGWEDFNEEDYGKHGSHAKWSASFITHYLPDEFKESGSYAFYHHNPQTDLQSIIADADCLSARERTEGKGNPRKIRLSSIFDKVYLKKSKNDTGKHISQGYKYPLTSLSLSHEALFPSILPDEDLISEYKKLWGEFTKEVKSLAKGDFNSFFFSLFFLLQKYTYHIPSAVYETYPDITLFDHLKTTSAIASCLYDFYNEEDSPKNQKEFLVIEGDISGIQKFIYKLASPQKAQSGMAQRLRGRSFYLSIMNETFALYILKKLNLYMPNLLLCGGGHFTILAPNTQKSKREIEGAKEKINLWLYQKFQGDLYFALSVLEIDKEDLSDWSKVSSKTGALIKEEKKKKFLTLTRERKFELKNKVCIVCENDFDNEDNICPLCKSHEKIGEKLPYNEYLVQLNPDNKNNADIRFEFDKDFGFYWQFKKKEHEITDSDVIQTYKLNDTEFLSANPQNISYGFKFIGKNSRILTFEEMQGKSEGAKFLSALRMDVDNLGAVFSIGLGEDKSISRISTLSRTLDIFFSGYLNEICKDHNSLYITYSGGDDLFIVGAWNEIVEIAQKIKDEFRDYTCKNDDISISGGIFLFKSKFPIGRAATLSGDKLEDKAKKLDGKNGLAIFEKGIHWEPFEKVINLGDKMVEAIKLKRLSRRFLYGLLELSRKHIRDNEQDLLWIPKFLYMLKRNVEKEDEEGNPNPLFAELQTGIPKLSSHIPVLVAYTVLKTRRKR
ncbi:type III-A CRISPR-associated protein Cas10/Csm1 [candidate division WOR-3 bacterium JGI_Cruoil_03_44_89]|uniref:CRISPR system single-strand-specific deoxyribonuclease Cas10/Csm1 (subtype III-A) n=1 Tax=candidate division WOR-3 bacterium JGI_Cruoil_03_44_89 TaxID=1973748 RepID=A0A235BN49_UNCW3|nr:MAG: type III-A CRISPR-associated protein Cas10/Csm1 [candidate division WOR-3 bacterium JGI_Cruoil_03_44_89]